MKGVHDRTLQNSSCKNALMFMVWEFAQTFSANEENSLPKLRN